MAKADWASVDEYIAAQPEAEQRTLRRVRTAIRRALPGAEEGVSYKMPAYKMHGRAVLHFAAWKQHYSLYAATARVIAVLGDELRPYEVRKGTILFPYSAPVPVKLIERIARLRGKDAGEGEGSKLAAAKKR